MSRAKALLDLIESGGGRKKEVFQVWVMDGEDLITKMSPEEFCKSVEAPRNTFLQDAVKAYNNKMEKEGSSQRAELKISGMDFK